ncbi:hypothetical protein ACS3SW_19485 [Roseobacteraceae bacterium S113]
MSQDFDAFLDDISQCFVERDLALWRSRLLLPFSVITQEGPVVLPSEGAVAENFGHYLTAMDAMQLDMVDRRAISLEDCKDGTYLGTFETRLVSRGQLATAPYTATALLRYEAGRLRMASMLNGRGHREWTGVSGR